MSLAIFDLDETLLSGDSDHAWGEFVAEKGVVDAASYRLENDRFYQDYRQGSLDVMAYLRFVLRPLIGMSMDKIGILQEEFMRTKIEPMIAIHALDLIQRHREKGDTLVIITATNQLITAPIAKRMGVENLLAAQVEMAEGKVTGKVTGIPTFREGKVKRLQAWLEETGGTLEGSVFYSDSHNDLPLLEFVQRPVAVDPDAELRKIAAERGWEIISLR